jgi:ATP-dependent DNA helicase RecG
VPRLFVGTQSLLSMPGLDLAALVVDEQHKFSVDQRARIAGQHTHIIESSATPIPRTLALALFDGWDYALIRHGPTSKTITNHVIPEKARQQARELVQKHLRASRKVIFLYPSVNGKAGSSVMSRGKALQEWFAGKVGIIHGKLKPQEKIDAIARFRDGTTSILVASTAVEVGVDVPDVGLMVVSGADRFGVSQLHQLRGRLVRNGGEGDFVMMTPASVSKATLERLNAVAQNNNGFDLAQRDLELRGFGNVLGDMQTGDSTTLFKLARLEPADFFAG